MLLILELSGGSAFSWCLWHLPQMEPPQTYSINGVTVSLEPGHAAHVFTLTNGKSAEVGNPWTKAAHGPPEQVHMCLGWLLLKDEKQEWEPDPAWMWDQLSRMIHRFMRQMEGKIFAFFHFLPGFCRQAFCSAFVQYIPPDCHKVIIILLAKTMYLTVASLCNRETPGG